MRLTLRTLLAYLDDRLSSGNAREIGKKLAESPFAQELADRIRAVVRQRRLTTPGRKVKMIDPNLIAEYLDDQLTPELVSLIEKEVLASDFSLAEVAAAHEIIGLLGDPVELDRRLKERLLKQNPHRSADEFSDHELDEVTQAKHSDPVQDVWKPLAKQKGFSPRSPALILAALLIGWLALLLTDQFREPGGDVVSSGTGSPAAQDPDQHDHAADEHVDEAGRGADADPADAPEAMLPPAVDARGDDRPAAEFSTEPVAEEPKVDRPAGSAAVENSPDAEAVTTPDAVPEDPEPADPAASIADADAPAATMPDRPQDGTDSEAAGAAIGVRQFEFAVNDPHGMLLSRARAGGDWTRAVLLQGENPNWHDLITDRISALPAPFSAEMTPIHGGWSATMASPCLFRFSDGVQPELQLYDGRCVIVPEVVDGLGDDNGARELRLVAGGVAASCSAAGEDMRLGVLVVPAAAIDPAGALPDPDEVLAPGSDADQASDAAVSGDTAGVPEPTEVLPLDADVYVTLFVAAGSAVVRIGDLEPITVGQGRALNWTTTSGQPETIQLSDQGQLNAVPDWVYTVGDSAVPEIETAKSILASTLEESDSTIAAAEKICRNRNPVVARFAAAVLTVTREVESLVQILLQTEEEQVRIEAIRGLQQTAAQTLRGRQVVLRALENRLPMRELSHFVRLLQRVTPAEAQQEETSVWLVAMLRHDRASIRQMAYMILVDLTGQTNGYHPDSDPGRRNESVRRWERLLKKNNNRLLAPE